MALVIDSKNHIELDGVHYRLAESAEGQHHNVRGEPLRPPNAVTVQGENSQKFQPRPEVLLWNWTDWSQGEGRRTQKFGEAGRSWQLNAVRAFEEPGHLIPGYYCEITQDNTGAADLAKSLVLVAKGTTLYGLDADSANVYQWDGSKWGAATALTGVTAGANPGAVGDQDAIYWQESGTQKLWKWTGSGAPTTISTTLGVTSAVTDLAQTDDYIYVFRAATPLVVEVAKTGSSQTDIDSYTNTGDFLYGAIITELDGRIYTITTAKNWTSIREITPSSAAGTGFGREIARLNGFQAEALWSHNGTLYMVGNYRDPGKERAIIYLQPGGSYGTLGELRQGDDLLQALGGGTRMLDHFFVTEQLNATDSNHALFQVDSISGGVSCVSYDEVGDATGGQIESIFAFEGSVFWSTAGGAGFRTMRADPTKYMINSSAISPEHDFDLVSKKFLSSLVLGCEPLPADWTIYVDYQKDGDGTWTNAITYNTTSGTGTEAAITTDSSTVEFRRLQLRVRFAYTGGGVPTSAPVLLGIEARAVVAEKVKVFQYLLDLSTDQSAGKQSRSGASKVDTFLATAVKATSVDLKDGYTSPRAGEYDQYDVFVDEYNVVLDRPGEGIAAVTLREVI